MVHKIKSSLPLKRRLRFREEDDQALLREVASLNPFANTEAWELIKQNINLLTGKDFSLKTLKDHLDLLIKLWLEKVKTLKDKSDFEDYTEKDQLCQDIYDSMKVFRGKRKPKTPLKNESAEKVDMDYWTTLLNKKENGNNNIEIEEVDSESNVDDIISLEHKYCTSSGNKKNQEASIVTTHEDSMTCVSVAANSESIPKSEELCGQQSKVLYPVRSRKRKLNMQQQALSYLNQYDRNQVELKKQEQALEERKIILEEKKVQCEERKLELAERKLALQEKEKTQLLDILNQHREDISKIIEKQDKIIEILLHQMKNK